MAPRRQPKQKKQKEKQLSLLPKLAFKKLNTASIDDIVSWHTIWEGFEAFSEACLADIHDKCIKDGIGIRKLLTVRYRIRKETSWLFKTADDDPGF